MNAAVMIKVLTTIFFHQVQTFKIIKWTLNLLTTITIIILIKTIIINKQVWADIYAKALEGKDVKEILAGFNSVGASSAAPAASAAAGSTEAAAEEKEASEAEESDDDMGFGLFD